MKQVRTRFAPSPTGLLHIGGLRTALYSYAWAKKHGGTFVLRIEDTDQARFVPAAVEQIIRALNWAGIVPDEGVVGFKNGQIVEKGEYGPYLQSRRISLYTEFAQKLLREKKAYQCFCTPARLEEMRKIQLASKQMPKYDRHCLNLSDEEKAKLVTDKTPSVVRFFVPEGGKVGWEDAVFGQIEFEREQVDDFVMIKADGFPTYNFANVVDDHTMKITHVIRAYEFLSSTPKHLLLYEALGADQPCFAHASHILGKDKKKLSKRHAAVSVDEYKKMGYLPSALNNFIALLGWTHPKQQELFSLAEFVAAFDIADMNKTGAIFDTDKSLWMNGQYIRALSSDAFLDLTLPFLVEAGLLVVDEGKFVNKLTGDSLDKKSVQAMLATEQPRLKRLSDVAEAIRFYLDPELSYEANQLVWKKMQPEQLPTILQEVRQALNDLPAGDWTAPGLQQALQGIVTATAGRGVGDVFWPVRVALTGKEQSPSPQDVAAVLGKIESLRRIDLAIERVNKLAR